MPANLENSAVAIELEKVTFHSNPKEEQSQRINVLSEAEVDVFFLEFSCFFYDPTDVGNLISGSSAFSKSSLYIWKFLVHVLPKPSLKDFEHHLTSY